jgi:hypothetical protein
VWFLCQLVGSRGHWNCPQIFFSSIVGSYHANETRDPHIWDRP